MSDYDETIRLGDCFKAAGDLATLRISGDKDEQLSELDNITLVHGIVTGQGPLEGLRYTHAWIEATTREGLELVIDRSNGRRLTLPKALYFLVGKIEDAECERYSFDDACKKMLEFAHYGPWDGAPAAHRDPEPHEINAETAGRQAA